MSCAFAHAEDDFGIGVDGHEVLEEDAGGVVDDCFVGGEDFADEGVAGGGVAFVEGAHPGAATVGDGGEDVGDHVVAGTVAEGGEGGLEGGCAGAWEPGLDGGGGVSDGVVMGGLGGGGGERWGTYANDLNSLVFCCVGG